MQMATGTASEVHRRSEAVGDFFFLPELILACLEKRELVLVSPAMGAPAPALRRAPRDPGLWRTNRPGTEFIAQKEETDDRKYQQRNDELFHSHSSFAEK